MEAKEREILYYRSASAEKPFQSWRTGFTDRKAKAAIDARVARMRSGNFSDSKPIGGGASESRIDFGPGYRLYYGVDNNRVILLCGGDKGTQDVDIQRAKTLWEDYKKRARL